MATSLHLRNPYHQPRTFCLIHDHRTSENCAVFDEREGPKKAPLQVVAGAARLALLKDSGQCADHGRGFARPADHLCKGLDYPRDQLHTSMARMALDPEVVVNNSISHTVIQSFMSSTRPSKRSHSITPLIKQPKLDSTINVAPPCWSFIMVSTNLTAEEAVGLMLAEILRQCGRRWL